MRQKEKTEGDNSSPGIRFFQDKNGTEEVLGGMSWKKNIIIPKSVPRAEVNRFAEINRFVVSINIRSIKINK